MVGYFKTNYSVTHMNRDNSAANTPQPSPPPPSPRHRNCKEDSLQQEMQPVLFIILHILTGCGKGSGAINLSLHLLEAGPVNSCSAVRRTS